MKLKYLLTNIYNTCCEISIRLVSYKADKYSKFDTRKKLLNKLHIVIDIKKYTIYCIKQDLNLTGNQPCH